MYPIKTEAEVRSVIVKLYVDVFLYIHISAYNTTLSKDKTVHLY